MNLSEKMEFDRVLEILPYGEKFGIQNGFAVTERDDIWAPVLMDEALDNPQWEFFSTGYSRQDGYKGPIMHDSEFIGGRLERDILASPGIYAAVVAYWSSEDEEEETAVEGWAIVKLKEKTK